MTREQAINSMISHGFKVEQVGEIIKAVTPQFSSELDKNSKKLEKGTAKNDLGVDLISRKQAIEEADKLCLETGYDNEKVIEMLEDLPSVTPQLSVPEVTALAEWTTKLIEANKSAYSQGYADGMKAQAEPKTGHWIDTNDDSFLYHRIYKCSHCGDIVCDYPENIQKYKYCFNCGADMREVEE